MPEAEVILSARRLRKVYATRKLFGGGEETVAVDDVSFDVRRGETFGLIGESGSGKSTIGRLLLRLIEPTSGEISFDGTPVTNLSAKEMIPLRRRMQIVFQDSASAFNPRKSIGEQIAFPMRQFATCPPGEVRPRVLELMERIGLNAGQADRYPHEVSGGQRQRVSIARALAAEPDFVVLDEPTSALDVSIQAQILNLLQELQEEEGLTYLLISHDLGVVEHFCDRAGVLDAGNLVELADTEDLYVNPKHRITRKLLDAVLEPEPSL